MKRSKHSLSHYVLATFDMGQLVPVSCLDVLPGDSIRMSTSCLLRCSPLMTPVMHPVVVRLHHWFVPYRILWDGWEDFITGGPDGLGAGEAFPVISGTPVAKGLGDYFGIPPGVASEVSALPFRAYNRIWEEFYRDQDLEAEVPEDSTTLQYVSWEKDYFTVARPWTQKGPDVTIPISGMVHTSSSEHTITNAAPMKLRKAIDGSQPTASRVLQTGGTGGAPNTDVGSGATPAGSTMTEAYFPSNLVVDELEASVNAFRLSFALQRYQEARAQYGSRFTEYLRYLGVRSSDARLQRPEYLGGGRSTISFSEVLRTGDVSSDPDPEAPIGEMRGHGISAMRSRRFIRFIEEHGVVMTLASIRPRSMYVDGLHRQWSKRTKEDYWQKELEQIGQQEIFNREVYAAHTTPAGVFGYGDRYSEYRHHPSYVTGEFRTTHLDWHLGRSFAGPPALNAGFVTCDPTKRVFAEQTQNSIWGMFSHSIQARRLVGKKTIGRIF